MIESADGGVLLLLLIQPKASKSEIVGPHNGALKIRIQAPPIEGRANEELVAFLAGFFGVPKRSVSVLKGETGRRKTVFIAGITIADATSALSNL